MLVGNGLAWLVGWSPGSLQSGLWCCLSRSTARGSGFGRSFSCWNWFWWSSLCCTRPTQMALFQPHLVESTLCCRKRHKTAVLLGNFFFNGVWGGDTAEKRGGYNRRTGFSNKLNVSQGPMRTDMIFFGDLGGLLAWHFCDFAAAVFLISVTGTLWVIWKYGGASFSPLDQLLSKPNAGSNNDNEYFPWQMTINTLLCSYNYNEIYVLKLFSFVKHKVIT